MINTEGFFEEIFKRSKENSILMLDGTGKILDINKGFMSSFGYIKKDLRGKNFEILFTPNDREKNKPSLEIKHTLSNGSASDNN